MSTIKFVFPGGEVRDVEAAKGISVMEAAKAAGIDQIIAECGGALNCATCHVYVADDWLDKIPAPDHAERDLLECVVEPRAGSRLSCQILFDDTLDGIVIEVPEAQF